MTKKPPTLHLVLPVTCGDEYCDERPRVAQITVTPAVVRLLLADIRKVRRLKKDRWSSLCNVEVFDYSVNWGERIDEDQVAWPARDLYRNANCRSTDDLDGQLILVAQPLPLIVGEHSCRTDCARRSIYDDRIHWAAYLKHTNIEVTTESIRRENLERVARVLQRIAETKEVNPDNEKNPPRRLRGTHRTDAP